MQLAVKKLGRNERGLAPQAAIGKDATYGMGLSGARFRQIYLGFTGALHRYGHSPAWGAELTVHQSRTAYAANNVSTT
jgi:hypothetical protein